MAEQLQRAELAHCTSCACFNLRKVTRAVTQLYDEMLRPAGLRVTQFSLLVAVRMAGPVGVMRLAEITVMDRTTLTRNLELLQKQGLIEVTAGADRRSRIVTITAEGNGAIAEALPFWKKAQSHVVNSLGQERWADMLMDLEELVALTNAK
ncbi:MAG TPA: MarR family winged helix-turn-helix transcriptional regulator [Gammaproteobacteria bacterium]|nr:MarR family winged helix-turn-helix transcriptional regulator [Gammaproteobacteria bacterium]